MSHTSRTRRKRTSLPHRGLSEAKGPRWGVSWGFRGFRVKKERPGAPRTRTASSEAAWEVRLRVKVMHF
jgi:hypothetical protein